MFLIGMKKTSQCVTCHLKEEAHPVPKKLPQSRLRTILVFLLVTQAITGDEVLRRVAS
jgi:hypothetical protein